MKLSAFEGAALGCSAWVVYGVVETALSISAQLFHHPHMNVMAWQWRLIVMLMGVYAAAGLILGALNYALDWNGKSAPRESLRPFLPLAVLMPILAATLWVSRPAVHPEVLWCILLLAGAAAALYLLCIVRKPLALLIALNVLLTADLGYFLWFAAYAPADRIEEGLRKDGLAGLLAQDPDRFRVFSLFLPPDNKPSEFREQNALIGSAPPLWGLDSVRYHGSLELRRFERVIQGLTSTLREHPEQATKFSGFLNFLGAKYVTAPSNFAFAGWEKAGEEGGFAAWRIPGFRGGEYLVGRVAQEPRIADESIVPEIQSHPMDYKRTALIASEGLEDLRELEGSPSDVNGKIEPLPPRYDAMGFHVISDRPSLLVIANNYYPGWTATVNGRPARIHCTDWVGHGSAGGRGGIDGRDAVQYAGIPYRHRCFAAIARAVVWGRL